MERTGGIRVVAFALFRVVSGRSWSSHNESRRKGARMRQMEMMSFHFAVVGMFRHV